MTLISRASNKEISCTVIRWRKFLELALEYGWIPLGTQLVNDDTWQGGYYTNDGQIVTKEDAIALANAILAGGAHVPSANGKSNMLIIVNAKPPYVERTSREVEEALAYVRKRENDPNLEVETYSCVPEEYEQLDDWLKKFLDDPAKKPGHVNLMHNFRLPAVQFFGGQHLSLLIFANFCIQGEFEIH